MSYNQTTSNLCNSCTNTLVNSPCETGCLDIYNTSCIQYDGVSLSCLSVNSGDYLNSVLCSINNQLCTVQSSAGKVAVDGNDTGPDFLANKLVAGANIVISGIGSGPSEQLVISAVLGGQIIDQFVKVSATDQAGGFLADKISFGPCLYATKLNPGFNETYQISIDFQCVLNQLVALPAWTTAVNSVITPGVPMTCPYIFLNNPTISGTSATFTWSSNGVNYNVSVDGVIQPGMPTTTTTYTSTPLTNGSHTVTVTPICNGGTPNSASQTFLINTVCPVPNGLSVGITGGTASLTWSLTSSANNINQTVQYKPTTSSTWITAIVAPPLTTSYAIAGLLTNKLYDFQIINNCSTGGPSPSTAQTTIQFTCPNVSLTSTSSSISYSFANLGGDISSYTMNLYDTTGLVLVQSKTEAGPFASSINNTFSGLNPNTNYKLQVIVNAGVYNSTCAQQSISTTNAPACPSITNLNGTVS